MNDFIKTLETRRSVRGYTDKAISKEELSLIIEAGRYAPTGKNRQRLFFLAVTDKSVRDEISRLNASVLGVDYDPFFGAPNVIVVFSDASVNTFVEDGALAMGNMLNAAHSLGIDSCWIHRAREVFQLPEGRAIAEKYGVPDGYAGIGNCILGYRSGDYPATRERNQKVAFTK